MKKFMVMAAGLMMAAVLGACAPTARNTGETSEHGTAPAGAAQQETVDGVAEKESMVVTDADPTVTVCVYSVKSDKSGLKQNMDGIDGDELDAQELLDKMAEVGVIEEGITVDKFEQKDGALTLDLSSLKESSDKLVVMAIANTFIQNYEAKTLELSVALSIFIQLLGYLVQIVALPFQLWIYLFQSVQIDNVRLCEGFNDILLLALSRLLYFFFYLCKFFL